MNNSTLSIRLGIIIGLLSLVPAAAWAQPLQGQVALGGDVGVFLPADDQFDNAIIFGGLLEFYATRRLGFRGSVFSTSPEYTRGTDEAERQIRFGLDVIYNWEGGKVHPFVGAGLGLHQLQFTDNGDSIGDSDNKLGFALLGGIEYFLNRAWTIKGEARYHFVDDKPLVDPDGLALTIGLKRYF